MRVDSHHRFGRLLGRWALIGVASAVAIGGCACEGDDNDASPGTTDPPPVEQLPDLTITSATVEIVADPNTCNGSTTCLVVTVANRGDADATGLEDGCGTMSFGDPSPWASFTMSGDVPAGGSVTFRSGYDNLEPFLPAEFELICDVDAADRIAESDESNNSYSITLTR